MYHLCKGEYPERNTEWSATYDDGHGSKVKDPLVVDCRLQRNESRLARK